jgi:hypothetical protein
MHQLPVTSHALAELAATVQNDATCMASISLPPGRLSRPAGRSGRGSHLKLFHVVGMRGRGRKDIFKIFVDGQRQGAQKKDAAYIAPRALAERGQAPSVLQCAICAPASTHPDSDGGAIGGRGTRRTERQRHACA